MGLPDRPQRPGRPTRDRALRRARVEAVSAPRPQAHRPVKFFRGLLLVSIRLLNVHCHLRSVTMCGGASTNPARRRKGVLDMSESTATLNMPARTNRSEVTAQPRALVQNSLVTVDLPSLVPLMYALMLRNIA